jgi:hypothetical protein
MLLLKSHRLIMEWAIMELAEALMFVSVLRWNLVGKSEEEESEGLSQDKVEVRFLTLMYTRFSPAGMLEGVFGHLHLSESMYNGGMELMLVGEVPFVIAVG